MFLRIRMVWFIFLFLLPFTKLIAQKTKVSQLQNAEIEIMQSNYTGSILLLNEEIKKNPDHHLAYFLRGLAKKELGDNLGAYNDFSNSILLHPGFSKAYYHRCILKIDFKDYYNALSDINKALSYQVTNTDYYVARGYIYNILKDTTNALHDYNTAIFLDANNHNAYLNKSLLELNMKQYEKALSSINKSISIFPFSMNAFVIRGYIRLNSNDTAGAFTRGGARGHEDLQHCRTPAAYRRIDYKTPVSQSASYRINDGDGGRRHYPAARRSDTGT